MYIKRAIHKYGKDKFHISLLEEVSIERLNEREKYWITYYDSYNNIKLTTPEDISTAGQILSAMGYA